MYMHMQYFHFFEYQVLISMKQWIIEDVRKTSDERNEIFMERVLQLAAKNLQK